MQLHLVKMSNYTKFSVDTFNTFRVIGCINDDDDNNHHDNNHDDDNHDDLARVCLRNRQANNDLIHVSKDTRHTYMYYKWTNYIQYMSVCYPFER